MDLKLKFYGNSVLRAECVPVESFDANLAERAEAMIETMRSERGIGLAAPQVGRLERLIVVLRMRDPDDDDAEPMALVNPEVVARSKSTWELEEGCLSLPGISGRVVRPDSIEVRYQDLDGRSKDLRAEGMFARVLLHEIDHLYGRLFIDYLSSAQKSLIKSKLRTIAAEYST